MYETAPVGGPGQPDFLNAVLLAEHHAAGPRACWPARTRPRRPGTGSAEVPWGPRTLDVDIISYGDSRPAMTRR